MRLIFFTLLGVNALILAWGLFLSGGSGSVEVNSPALGVKVVTADSGASVALAEQGGAFEQGESKLCELVGPFPGQEDADVFVERLRSIDILGEVQSMELQVGESYWVHLPPEETPGSAYRKLAELQSAGIESYVIGRGELQNSVSLGVFTYKDLAESRQSELVEQGWSPVISVRPRTELEIWVRIQPEDAEKVSDITWSKLMEGMSAQERRQNFCLPVAS